MRVSTVGFLLTLFVSVSVHADVKKVDFNRDVRGILADNCYMCHGPDAKEVQGGLRLDLREIATKEAESGEVAIVPGKIADSELIRRILSDDESEMMPPPDSHKKLNATQKELLKSWIAEGAEYKDHWAFIPPRRREFPKVKNAQWAVTDVDKFVLAQLEAKGMEPSQEASRETLIRRVSLDLRGFPPTLEEIDGYVNDNSPNAYELMVDRMIASPHFGEKLARIWMDLARYGDTNGYHYDSTRQVWMWRDWVIKAYNENMPFDQFTVEQLAGDLMPNATVQQKIASGFNRNTRYNEEGGADPEEWRVEYAKDRVRTLGQVWLGMTVGCAECHSHKYDPISQKEFYQLYAFFNSLDEPGSQGHRQKYPPLLEVPTEEQNAKVAQLQKDVEAIRKQITEQLVHVKYEEPTDLAEPTTAAVDELWIDDAAPDGAKLQGDAPGWNWVNKAEFAVHSGERATKRTGAGLNQHFFTDAKEQLEIKDGDILFAWVFIPAENPPKTIQLQFNDGTWEHRAFWGERKGYGAGEAANNHHIGDLPKPGQWTRLEVPAKDVGLKVGGKLNGWAFTQFDGTVYYDAAGVTRTVPDNRPARSLAFWTSNVKKEKKVPNNVKDAIKVAEDKRTPQHVKAIRDYYFENVHAGTKSTFNELRQKIKVAEDGMKKAKESTPFQLVSVEMATPRPAHMLVRGEFDKPGEKVERETPKVFPALAEDSPRNRLGLAKWLVTGDHPMTARVTVNRYWAQLFGNGIVESIGDFGHLGSFPTHPDLLDYLAAEFVESGWDTKHVIKLMVMSKAYRQSPVNHQRYDELDPQNHLLSRSPRFRLPAEEIRDSALQAAGLLNTKVGGPPSFPYQPRDYYRGKLGGWSWNVSPNEEQYRRGMYTFWRRTTPYPTFVIFDAPDRSQCVVSRARTNTPLQALVTLNDPQFVEAARVFAQRVLADVPGDDDARIATAFRRAVARTPSDPELAILKRLLGSERKHYQSKPEDAQQLVKAGSFPPAKNLDAVEHAAWTAVCNAILNLDEMINRE
jgi:hypothetical protein